jgi:phosphoribosyl 1,2-cyclic phosphodiesterase
MKACALSSGSSGNCFYVEKDDAAVLVDVGISARKVIERMSLLKLNPEKIKAIFITHEHSDHIVGIDVLARRLNVPIFATKGTIKHGFLCSNNDLIKPINNNESIKIGVLKIEAFTKRHKAAEPVSYSILSSGKVVSVITDAGYACDNINKGISQSDLLFLESNHDIAMVESGPYPPFLKKWVTGDSGHLSNTQAGLAVLENARPRLKNIILSHISKTNNTPDVALETFKSLVKERSDLNPNVSVSLDHAPTQLFYI